MKFELPYVPRSYVPRQRAHALVWHHPTESLEPSLAVFYGSLWR